MSGGPVIKRERVRLLERIEPLEGAAKCSADVGIEKAVRLIEMDGQVHAIELTCTCGEVSVVRLEYPSGGTNDEAQ